MNRSLITAVFLILTLTSPLMGLEPPGITCASQAQAVDPVTLGVSGIPVQPEELIFVSLEGLAGGSLELEFEVDGAPFVTETLTLPRDVDTAQATPLVGVLATRPDLLHRLHALADDPEHRVEVRFWHDGTLLDSVPFSVLVNRSSELLAEPSRPEVLDSRVEGPGAETGGPARLVHRGTCEDQCYLDYLDCNETVCAPAILCEECEVAYEECLQVCDPAPPPICTPSVTYYWKNWYFLYSYLSGYQICYPDPWAYYEGVWHLERVHVFRRDQIEKTLASDCSITEQIVGYQYLFTSCYDWTYSPCYGPWYPYNTCY